jgi:hypothetical protein
LFFCSFLAKLKISVGIPMRDTRSADATRSTGSAVRGQLNERQWQDVSRAARIARIEGVTLKVHGIDVVGRPWLPGGIPVNQGQQEQVEAATPMQLSDGEEPVPVPFSKRQQRSQARLLDFQKRKRKQLLGASSRVQCFLRQFRWKRMQDVWTAWQRCQRVRSKLRGLLWREWTRPFGSLMSGSEWLGDVSRRDCYVRRCAIRLCDRAGLPRELARAPRARVCGKRAYATPPTLPGPTALVAACPGGKKSRAPEFDPSSGV